jgi:cell division septum initiation protein DivIVA
MAESAQQRAMSDEHRSAIVKGRTESRIVDEYLRFLEQNKPRRGRRRTPERVRMLLDQVTADLESATGVHKLELLQQRHDLEAELEQLERQVDGKQLEDAFVSVAKSYSERKGIAYQTWREVGVPVEVLERAGLSARSTSV